MKVSGIPDPPKPSDRHRHILPSSRGSACLRVRTRVGAPRFPGNSETLPNRVGDVRSRSDNPKLGPETALTGSRGARQAFRSLRKNVPDRTRARATCRLGAPDLPRGSESLENAPVDCPDLAEDLPSVRESVPNGPPGLPKLPGKDGEALGTSQRVRHVYPTARPISRGLGETARTPVRTWGWRP